MFYHPVTWRIVQLRQAIRYFLDHDDKVMAQTGWEQLARQLDILMNRPWESNR